MTLSDIKIGATYIARILYPASVGFKIWSAVVTIKKFTEYNDFKIESDVVTVLTNDDLLSVGRDGTVLTEPEEMSHYCDPVDILKEML